ncbi:hypothetical protein L218DRAFT_942173 [Marasmius fiardii PR-910]|nr:hypothetical protein L218DRAFT_942173 [Marasmius fiardii PR-910]
MIALQPPQPHFHVGSFPRSIDVASISTRSAFLSRENRLCPDFGRGNASRTTSSLGNSRDKDGSEGVYSGITTGGTTSQSSLETVTTPLQVNKDSPAVTVDAFNNSESSSTDSTIPIYDSKTPTSASRALSNRTGRFRKPISARSRYTGMPWVQASPIDLWQVVPADSHPTVQRPPFSPIQPQTQASRRGSSAVSDSNAFPEAIMRPNGISVPKAIGSERKQRLQREREQQPPVVDIVPIQEWNPNRQPKLPVSSAPVSVPERPKRKTVPLPPQTQTQTQSLPTPPVTPTYPLTPTPPLTLTSSSHSLIHTPIPTTPILTPALPVIHLPPAPQPSLPSELQHELLISKYESISKFNAHRFRHGTKYTPVPRFSSTLNPARETLSEVLGASGKDFIDSDRWEREKERERERERELERLRLGMGGPGLGLVGMSTLSYSGRRERPWNYFRKPHLTDSRSRAVCERSHSRSRSGSGGFISVASYLRGSDQKHCLGCRREGMRVRLLVVQVWRKSLWGNSSTRARREDLDFGFDLGLSLGLDLLGSDFDFDDDEDDEDDDEGELVQIHVNDARKRFVMDFWDDDDHSRDAHRVGERKCKGHNKDVPMDVDSDFACGLPGRLDEELMRAAQMEVDSDVVDKIPEANWVGGVPDSPRLKDLDDFEEM